MNQPKTIKRRLAVGTPTKTGEPRILTAVRQANRKIEVQEIPISQLPFLQRIEVERQLYGEN